MSYLTQTEALSAYDDLYYRLELEDESYNQQPDFHEPLLSSNPSLLIKLEDKSSLEGPSLKAGLNLSDHSNSFHAKVQKSNLHLGQDLTNSKKFPLNQATQRKLARDIAKVYYMVVGSENPKESFVELHKYMARPSGCSFLGATAVQRSCSCYNQLT